MAVLNQRILRRLSIWLLCVLLCCMITGCSLSDRSQIPVTTVPEATYEILMTTETILPKDPPTQPETETTFPVPEETLSYEEARLENSDRTFNSKNHHNAQVYCCYPVFSGSEAADVINADITRIAEAFAYTYTQSEIQEQHYAFGIPYAFSHTGFMQPTYNGSGVISILMTYGSFWGEDNIYDGGFAGYVYSMETGERLTLTQLTGLPEDQLLEILQIEADRILKERSAKWEFTDRSLVRPDALTLDNFGFYITEDKNIYATLNGIHMRQKEPARGYWVSIRFPTGFSISYY